MARWRESKPFSFCRSTVANNTLLVKTVRGMKRSHMRLVPTKTLVRGGLALVNEHQFHLQIVMIREPFRADFAQTLQGQCFDTEKLELHVQKVVGIVRSPLKAPGIVSYSFPSLEPVGRSRSRGTHLDFFFSFFFFKFTLLHSSWMSLTKVFGKCA